jgi:hypothetical protein
MLVWKKWYCSISETISFSGGLNALKNSGTAVDLAAATALT